MIVLYTSPGCASCRKAKAWLQEKGLKFIEKNIFQVLLHPQEIKYLLRRSEKGSDDIISKRSKIIQDNNYDIDNMSLNELVDFIIANPSVLKRPIILNDTNLQEITTFHRDALRKVAKCDRDCPRFPNCGRLRNEECSDD